MRKIFILVLLLESMCAVSVATSLRAEEQAAEEVRLYVGEIKTFPVDGPLRIVVGIPEVADVTLVTESEISVSAKAAGVTTFVFWDSLGEQDFRIRVFTEDMREAKMRVDSLIKELNLPKVHTKAMDSEEKVLLLGEVKTAQERESILTALGTLKEKVVDLLKVEEEEAIVDIDVQVLELDKDATHTLGFTWPGSIALTDAGRAAAVTGLTNVFHVSDFTRSAFNVTLDALVQEGKARILSRPRVACQSGKEAQLMVGGEKPIMTTSVVSGGGTSTEVSYKEFGIKLKIKPVVTPEKRIKLGLSVEVSDVGAAETLGDPLAPSAKAYPLSKRNVYTELALNDGQTLAIGGLRKQKHEEDVRKTPLLSDVPVLGALFRHKTVKVGGGSGERGDTELFITLTPTLVGAKDGGQQKLAVSLSDRVKTEVVTDPLQNYTGIIKKRIMDKLVYPAPAKESGFQGMVRLNLHLSYVGQLLDVAVTSSSGYKILDDNAVAVTKSIASYPPFPPSLNQKELWIEVPIVYSLD
jgi:pilus assembly protein CpaC